MIKHKDPIDPVNPACPVQFFLKDSVAYLTGVAKIIINV
jgi:hypothetical protein